MAYGSALVDNIQSSTANTPVVFKDGNGTQIGTLCRAWVNFNGISGSVAIRASFNVSSIVRNAGGDYTVNFTNAMPDVNYSATGSCSPQYGVANGSGLQMFADAATATEVTPATSGFRFYVRTLASNQYDSTYVNVSVFR